MVFFTCSHCGESVKKPSVAKHYQTKCRKYEPFLTCVDCLKDFKGTEYEAHTKCVTEDERYSAKGYVPKPSQNKGERKQQAWQECIQTVLKKPTLKSDERDLITAISKYENVPRKKSKFVNFLSNAFRQYANKTNLIDRVWTEMESVFKDMSNVNGQQNSQEEPQKQDSQTEITETPIVEENGVKNDKKRKRKAEEEKISDNSESGKTKEEKVKKKKQKTKEEVSTETTEISPEVEEQGEKKSKKRKTEENGQILENSDLPEETEPEMKRKKKKHENSESNETPLEQESPKKKKKNKKLKNGGETVETPTTNGDAIKRKGKKSENKENCGEEPEPEAGVEAQQSSKKSKEIDNESEKQETFNWKETILNILNKHGKNKQIHLQKLQKKVLKLHCQIVNCENSPKKEKKFMKKLKGIPEIEIAEDFVVLKS